MARLSVAAVWLAVGGVCVLGACSSGGGETGKATRGAAPGEAGPEAIGADGPEVEVAEGEERTEQLLSLMEQAQRNSEFDLDLGSVSQETTWSEQRAWEASRREPVEPAQAATAEWAIEEETEASIGIVAEEDIVEVSAAETRDDRRARLTGELAGVLRGEFDDADLAMGPALDAYALETIREGTLGSYFPELMEGSTWRGLSGPEREFLSAWREMQEGVREDASLGDVGAMAGRVSEAADSMRGLRGLRVTNAALATRVENYGVYDEVERRGEGGVYRFVAGKAHRVVVYAEVENFGRRADTRGGVEGHAVELTQALSLSHLGSDGGDLVAWSMPEQRVDYFSRRPVRDFFLTSVIDLPATLTVDRYALKVRVRDRVTGVESEKVIRIDMVAHASALGGRR